MNQKNLIYLSLLLFLISQNVFSQNAVVTGQLLSPDGDPLVGVAITIKGTNRGVITDTEGRYSIDAPLDGILVFSYIGYVSREVPVSSVVQGNKEKAAKVKDNHLNSLDLNKYFKVCDSINKLPGIYNISESSKINFNIIKKYDQNLYNRLNGIYNYASPFRFQFYYKTSFIMDQVSKLPEIQNEYVQGRNVGGELLWLGPENNEIYSWGPSLKILEYDGKSYAFDNNGSIVPKGLGNGKSVNTYNPADFFKAGLSNKQTLALVTKKGNSQISLTYHYTKENGVIPKSALTKNNFNFLFKTILGNRIDFGINSMALIADANFMSGYSQSLIMQSVFKTPISFDNSNELATSKAVIDSQSYILPNGQQRSYSPLIANNPYWLLNNLTDQEKSNWLLGSFNMNYRSYGWLHAKLEGSIENQKNTDEFGFNEGRSGFTQNQMSIRKNNQYTIFTKAGLYFDRYLGRWNCAGGLFYELEYLSRTMNRSDVAGSEISKELKNSRTVHVVNPYVNFEYSDIIKGDLSLRTITSTTLSKTYTRPTIGFAFYPLNFNYIYNDWIGYLKLFGSYSSGINEVPLNFKRGLFNSTLYNTSDYINYFEYTEVYNTGMLKPELNDRLELGINFGLFQNRLTSEFSLYTGKNKQVMVPVFNSDHFDIINGCDLQKKGYDFEMDYRGRFNDLNLQTSLSISKNSTITESVYDPTGIVYIGGFADVPVALVKGQPYGVILGNNYHFNKEGKMVIDNEGFPMVDNNLKVIGNPNPDYIIGWSTQLTYHGIELSFTFDRKKGGDIWNGTKNTLNYLGLSKESGEMRGESSYLFEGVHPDGSPNVTTVSFYDPDLPINENRWVRYGNTGVASEAIEDGSWLRLSELVLAYNIRSRFIRIKNFESIRLAVFSNNLFVITRYGGVDPQTKVLGFGNNYGLDYFNTPGLRTYGISCEFKF
jgi:hypothetical protein